MDDAGHLRHLDHLLPDLVLVDHVQDRAVVVLPLLRVGPTEDEHLADLAVIAGDHSVNRGKSLALEVAREPVVILRHQLHTLFLIAVVGALLEHDCEVHQAERHHEQQVAHPDQRTVLVHLRHQRARMSKSVLVEQHRLLQGQGALNLPLRWSAGRRGNGTCRDRASEAHQSRPHTGLPHDAADRQQPNTRRDRDPLALVALAFFLCIDARICFVRLIRHECFLGAVVFAHDARLGNQRLAST